MTVLNPFAANIDLTTKEGNKIYEQATAGSKHKFDLDNNPMNAENFKIAIEQAYKDYCWGVAINSIPVSWDENGNPAREVNVMKDFRQITEEELMIASGTKFDCNFAQDDIIRHTTSRFKIQMMIMNREFELLM